MKKPCWARLAKLFTVHGDLALSSCSPILPWLVAMLALICAGSVGTLPVRGGLFGLLAFSAGGYWQLAPRLAGAAKAGSCPGADGAALVAVVGVVVDAVLLSESRLVMTTVATIAPITTITATADPTIV